MSIPRGVRISTLGSHFVLAVIRKCVLKVTLARNQGTKKKKLKKFHILIGSPCLLNPVRNVNLHLTLLSYLLLFIHPILWYLSFFSAYIHTLYIYNHRREIIRLE